MKIEKYKPSHHPRPEHRTDVAVSQEFYCEEGLVKLFAFPGNAAHCAFTSLELWLAPYLFQANLKRCYHRRWHSRLASNFAWECGKQVMQ